VLKGVIFNAVEEALIGVYGEDTWDIIVENSGVSGAYTALGDYEEADAGALVAAAAALLGESIDDTWRLVGRHLLPQLTKRLANITTQFSSAEELLRAVNDFIHPEVELLYPDSVPPLFEFSETENGLLVRYVSARGLSALAEGLIMGCGDLYSEEIEIELVDGSLPTDAQFIVKFLGV
jgi:hypothetical protein